MTRPRLRRLLATALLALAGSRAHALGADYGPERFATHDAVTWVQTCGTWGPDHHGTYRVIHAEAFAQSFLYVQWMVRGEANRSYSLYAVHTTAIAELDNDHAEISLSELTCRATPRGIVVTAKADSGHDDKLRRVTIEVGPAAGQYRFRAQRTR
ncbi:hypothetical protein [Variovorax sp. Root473]|uniref:hypothetical protein n=1 Tax=Variovorax sp. Root473 TaxID=1736541 RepID=UPI0006FD7C81|nr:hypothetical protein [Variovorax sp. Root473]KQX88191.1 hypothetical protein ASD34_14890 [Variovorax sp. Root473]